MEDEKPLDPEEKQVDDADLTADVDDDDDNVDIDVSDSDDSDDDQGGDDDTKASLDAVTKELDALKGKHELLEKHKKGNANHHT